MYNVPYVEPRKTSGEEIYLAAIAPEAYVPAITAPTLFLNGSNDHHGGHERGLESFKRFKPGVPWAFAIQARGHHDTDKVGQDAKLWLEKYVLGKEIAWPDHPRSELTLDAEGVPQLVVMPAAAHQPAGLGHGAALRPKVAGAGERVARLQVLLHRAADRGPFRG